MLDAGMTPFAKAFWLIVASLVLSAAVVAAVATYHVDRSYRRREIRKKHMRGGGDGTEAQ